MRKDKVFHVISNTHWDREWRFPFQRNRQMLVEMIDNVLHILEKEPEYRAFHLDSQSVVLTDYLEIRPDKKELIIKLVKEKRLLIGPWFILPDEFLVGGENLIRNLLLGHKICNEFGGVSKVGYSPFSWGQISQLPQLYKEFGIDVIMFYRGVNSLDSYYSEFLWEGSDGTKTLTSRFSTMPRYNFYFYIYRPVIHNEGFNDIEYKWERGGVLFHFADSFQSNEDYFTASPPDTYYKDNIKSSVEAIINAQADDFTTPHVIWMEGHDSSGPNIKTVQIIKDIKEQFPELNIIHSTLEDYSNQLKESADYEKLTLVKGERRSSQYDRRSGNLYGYTTSARMFLKQINFHAENYLQFYAEPFNSFAGIFGLNIDDRYLDVAWNYLIQNSAHDSIGGCSLDEIHEDMISRYKQTIEISKGVFERSIKHLVKQISINSFNIKNENPVFLVTFNPTNYNRNEIVEANIDIPQDYDKEFISVVDESGKKYEVQLIEKSPFEPVLEQLTDRPMYLKMNRYKCYLHLKNVPQFGYKTLLVNPVNKIKTVKENIVVKKKNSIHLINNKLSIKVNENGTLNIKDKINNLEFNNIGYFYDEGEGGHAWVNKPISPFVTTLNDKPKISIIENGNLSATVLVHHKIKLPLNLSERSKKKVKKEKVTIDFYITLRKDSDLIEFNIKVNNTVESHRLRIMFPTNIEAKYSYGEGQFDIVKRSTERPDTKEWIEQPMYDFPLHHFVDISDNKKGAAVIVDGLKEYEYKNDKEKTLAITLIRSFEYKIQPSSVEDYSWQKGSQCLGLNEFKLAFYPHKGNWQKGNVYENALSFNTPLRLVQISKPEGTLPPQGSFIIIEPKELIFSAFKKAEYNIPNCFVLRLYNPTNKTLEGSINTCFVLNKAEQTTLEELFIQEIKLTGSNSFNIKAEPKKIITLKLYL